MYRTTTITIPQPFGEPTILTHDLNGFELFSGIVYSVLCYPDRYEVEAVGMSPDLARVVQDA